MGETFGNLATSGPLLFAIAGAALAGLVSFLSPCVLPLVPGYLSYVTGLAGSELERNGPLLTVSAEERTVPNVAAGGGLRTAVAERSRVLAGTMLFIIGFTTVFVLVAVLVSRVGWAMVEHRRALEIVVGSLIIVLALAFLGVIPGLQRELRIQALPKAGLLAAPVFGAVFALSWVPCVGPTMGSVLLLASTSGQADRAVVLAVAYCLGLGIPFVVFGLFFTRLLGLFKLIRRNSKWVTRVGGVLLILIGLALVTGGWNSFLIWLQTSVGVGSIGI
ncbi:cytochrome c biogenesis CcdA family protein [Asanoa iriomotensis]|uniref:Cytochrome C biogenesis protein CcdA n=1 Tax=Asanoa iriomotensis TaxID=234613 RepID=A0ABQ4C4Y7_9ACTN|nr:cytochrome c biogenesis protein CcdA [Asanoa iriomotensis]GIF57844.1 cytochrome C biogenesis protein CcdA [Asanoa iriomotensis]